LDVRRLAKLAMVTIGARVSERTLHVLNGLFDYVELGWWLHAQGFSGGLRLPSCFEIPTAVAAEVGHRPVHYLQVGADDVTMAMRWGRVLSHEDTRLTVLAPPTTGDRWLPGRGHGHAWEFQGSVGRDPAQAASGDRRIDVLGNAPLGRLLERYEWPEALPLVAVFDTDHYATTKRALDFLGVRMPPTTYLFFDQLNHRADELRAFHEFLAETNARFEIFAANRELSCVVFRRRAAAP